MRRVHYEPGVKFWYWTVIGPAENDARGKTRLRVRCACGLEAVRVTYDLSHGFTRSCGCATRATGISPAERKKRRKGRRERLVAQHPLHDTWDTMIDRCHRPSSRSYGRYGGRGIRVCVGWRTSLAAFVQDMGPRPSSAHSIDRVDNDRGYDCGKCADCLARNAPPNCRWATSEEQQNNRRNNIVLEHNGMRMTMSQWSRHIGINVATLYRRHIAGWSVAAMLDTPARSKRLSRQTKKSGLGPNP